MTEAEILSVVLARVGSGWGITSISDELKGVLLDISARADFLTDSAVINTVADTAEYAEPANIKSIYECSISGSGLLEEKTYRQFLEETTTGTVTGEPTKYAKRHDKLYLWPVPDGVYNVSVDYSLYHPTTFTDVLFDEQFYEAIYKGVTAALYEGQIYEQLRLDGKTVDTATAGEIQDYSFSGGTDDAAKNRELYEAEIAKLIANLNVEMETVLVEYRDI